MKKRKLTEFADRKQSKKNRASLSQDGSVQVGTPNGKAGKRFAMPVSTGKAGKGSKKRFSKAKNTPSGNFEGRQRKEPERPVDSTDEDEENDSDDESEERTDPRERLELTGADKESSGSSDDDDNGGNDADPIRTGLGRNTKPGPKDKSLGVRTSARDDDDSDEDSNDYDGGREAGDRATQMSMEQKVSAKKSNRAAVKESKDTSNPGQSDSSDGTDSEAEDGEEDESEKNVPEGDSQGGTVSPGEGDVPQGGASSEAKDGGGTGEMSHDDAQKFTNAILTKTSFASLKDSVCEGTLRGISDMGFTYMTEIQERTLPHLLEGRDLLAAAKTGSGKTLAFLIPAIELIYKLKFMPRNGTGVMIISPTRELCMQIYGVLKEVMTHHYHTYGIVMGGTNRTSEVKKLEKGVNILVATPGRLLDHMQKTPQFLFKNLQCLVIDEADRILDIGFEEDMKQIVKLLPKKRQTMLFSATQTRKTEDLARISLKKQPIYIGVDDEKTVATVNGLEQGYVFCPSEKRFLLLFTFLKKNRSKKVMVFMSSCKSVKFHSELLNYIDLPVACIHGRKKQANRTTTFFQFCQAKQGILICTDVAARGLDIPAVDWIVQFDPPDDPKEYIHRVGRTARGLHGKGHALLILRPEEAGFLRYLKHAKVPISEYDFSWAKVANIQIQLEKLIEKNYFLHVSAKEAYKSYIRAYQSHSLKKIFKLESLDLNLVAKSFGFRVPPSVDLIVPTRKKCAGRDKGQFNPRQHNYKKAQKAKIFRHVESKRDKKDMRSALTH